MLLYKFFSVILPCVLSVDGFLLDFFTSPRNFCPSQRTYSSYLIEFGDKCYELILNAQVDWVHAQLDCRRKGGRLVTIENSYEQQVIVHALQRYNYHGKGIWIGLNDIQSEGTFVWDSGKAVTFEDWGYGQPDDYFHNQHQDCVLLYIHSPHIFGGYQGSSGWHDQLCRDLNGDREDDGWICEYDGFQHSPKPTYQQTPVYQLHTQSPKPTVSGCPSLVTYLSYYKVLADKCYEFILSKPMDWVHAQLDCKSKGGHLVTIESSQEEKFLVHFLQKVLYSGRGVWIGLNDIQSEGQYVWDSGKQTNFMHWETGQPNDNDHIESQDCVLMYTPSNKSPNYETDKNGHSHLVYQDSPGWHDQTCQDFSLHEDNGWICEYYIQHSIKASTQGPTVSQTVRQATKIPTTPTSPSTPKKTSTVATTLPTTTKTTTLATTHSTKPTTTSTPMRTTYSTTPTPPTTIKQTTTPVPFIIGK